MTDLRARLVRSTDSEECRAYATIAQTHVDAIRMFNMRRLYAAVLVLFLTISCSSLAESNTLDQYDTPHAADKQKVPLVVKGYGFDPYMIPSFMHDCPDIPLVIDNEFSINRTQFISAIQSGDPSVDIYVLPDSWNVWSLIDKGFALDLSAYKTLDEQIRTMYPQVQQSVMLNGRICALPIAMNLSSWTVRPDLLKAAGYEHMPATMTEFFEMLKEWDNEKEGDYDFAFCSNDYVDYDLRLFPYIEMAIYEYISQYEQQNSALSFDTPQFRQVLTAIEALGYMRENVDEAMSHEADDAMFTENVEAIFDIHDNNPLNVGLYNGYKKTLIPPPPFDENGARRATALVYLAIINLYSHNIEDAVAFLIYAAKHSATDATLTLYPDKNDPVPDQGILESLRETEQELQRQRTLLEGADEEHKADIEQTIIIYEAAIEELRLRQDLVSSEAIQAYRSLATYLYIPRDSPYRRASMEMKK